MQKHPPTPFVGVKKVDSYLARLQTTKHNGTCFSLSPASAPIPTPSFASPFPPGHALSRMMMAMYSCYPDCSSKILKKRLRSLLFFKNLDENSGSVDRD